MQGTGLLRQDETKDEPGKKRKGKFNASQTNFHNILEMNGYHVNKNEDAYDLETSQKQVKRSE